MKESGQYVEDNMMVILLWQVEFGFDDEELQRNKGQHSYKLDHKVQHSSLIWKCVSSNRFGFSNEIHVLVLHPIYDLMNNELINEK